jgi:hypothetical protein
VQLGDLWENAESKRRDERKGRLDGGDSKSVLAPHPFDCSLRSAVLKLFLELLTKKASGDAPQTAVAALQKLVAEPTLDHIVFRGKSPHPEPVADKPWVWAYLFQERAPIEKRNWVTEVCSIRCSKGHVSPQRAMDGPILKRLLAWMQKHRDRPSRARDAEEGGDAQEESQDDMDMDKRGKRGRAGR